ncbi:unnamed protein product [Trichogramma brassicae]|uniref:CCHC-type domain-containing protein n=1 Tax=Trichogramma brassicae TaxID=86971 RepID=A0A6H5HWV7_9HYME|nr:unnamed protein product [Trichogramma brassicae]
MIVESTGILMHIDYRAIEWRHELDLLPLIARYNPEISSARYQSYGTVLKKLAAGPAEETGQESDPGAKAKAPDPKAKVKPAGRPRTGVVVVKAKDPKSYAEILKLLRSEPTLQDSVSSVNKVRRSAGGELLQLDRACTSPDELGRKLDSAIGELGSATSRTPMTAIEIKDLDGATELGLEAVRSLRKAFAGTQTAVVTLPDQLAAKAIKLGRIRVGWVNCRIREKNEVRRCYRCWEPGHMAARCRGPDRKSCCRRCGQEGHMAKICQNVPSCLLCRDSPTRNSQACCPTSSTRPEERPRYSWPATLMPGRRSGGSRETKPRGEALLDALAPLDVLLLNTGSKPTFVGQQGESIVDLTFAGVSLHDRVRSWHVSDVYTGSDHQAIVFEVLLEENRIVSRPPAGNRKWSARTFDGDCFAEVVSAMNIRPGIPEDMVDELMSTIVRACDASMSRGGDRRRREPVYWWNDSIEECRRSCLRLRRRAQRARGRADETICREEFADARRRLHRAIKASKRLCWRQLCDEADCDVWGKPYRVVMSRLRAPRTSPPSAPELVRRAVSTLFPMIVPRPIDAPPLLEEHLIPEVGVKELRWAYGRVRIGAAPGPDGIPNIALKGSGGGMFRKLPPRLYGVPQKGVLPD